MIQQLANNITESLVKKAVVTEENKEIYVFGFEAIIATVINFVIILVLGASFGLLLEAVIYLLAFSILRVYCGGYHAKTHLSCILTFVFLFGIVMTIIALTPSNLYSIISVTLGICCVLIVFVLAPIEHENRRFQGNEYKQFRLISRIIAVVELLIIIFISLFLPSYSKLAYVMSMAMLNVSFVLAFAKYIEKKEVK